MKRRYAILLGAAAIVVVVLGAFEWFTGLLITAPRLDFASLADIHPAVRLQINTAPIEEEIVDHIRTYETVAPEFVVRSMLPHGFSVWMAPNYHRHMVEIRTLIQERRGGPLIARVLNGEGSYAVVEEFAFDVNGVQAPKRGAVTLDGWFPMEKNAADQLFKEFSANRTPATRDMDGTHLLEARADNSNGAAYLVFAALLHAFNIDLSEQEEKISLTSFKFVDEVAITANVISGNSLGIVCEMEIERGQKDKLAIANLKGGLDKFFTRFGRDLNADHGLTFTGQSEWHGDTLVFTYRLDDVPTLLKALRQAD